MEYPKKLDWKKFSLSEKIISIFGFTLPLFWIVAYIYDLQDEKNMNFFNKRTMKILFYSGYFHIIIISINLGIALS